MSTPGSDAASVPLCLPVVLGQASQRLASSLAQAAHQTEQNSSKQESRKPKPDLYEITEHERMLRYMIQHYTTLYYAVLYAIVT